MPLNEKTLSEVFFEELVKNMETWQMVMRTNPDDTPRHGNANIRQYLPGGGKNIASE